MSRLKYHHDSAPTKSSASEQSMKGFDAEFTDIVDYILRITYRIWEGKQVGLCFDYYSQDCPVYTLAGYTQGYDEVVQNTLNTLSSYPDRRLDADNIIWSGDDENGFHTSHLIDTKMTNKGASEFGPATQKNAQFKVIAHCVIKENRIVEEWLVRDNYALAVQLGFSPDLIVREWAKTTPRKAYSSWLESELQRLEQHKNADRKPASEAQSSSEYLVANLHNIWNARMLGDVFQLYAPEAKLFASAGRDLQGQEEIVGFYVEFLGAFSQLQVAFDWVCDHSHKTDAQYVAVRWTMSGLHSGQSVFGEPTGARILIIGESQYQFDDKGKVIEEYTVFDQLAIMTQIERARRLQLENHDAISQE